MDNLLDIRVASLIETGKIVINKGLKDNIQENMEFLIYEEGEEIFDPVSKESLGQLENTKGTFKTLHVQERMTLLISNTGKPHPFTIAGMAASGVYSTPWEMLKTIRVGDKVKIINRSKI